MSGLALSLAAAAFYLWAAFRQWRTLNGRAEINRIQVLTCTMIGALLHLGYLGDSMMGHAHLNFSMLEVGSLISWVMVLLLLFSSWRKPIDNLLIGVLPFTALLLIVAGASQTYVPLPHLGYGLAWHILLSILAFSVFVIAAVQAVLMWLQNQALKQRKTQGIIQALPSLQSMDTLLFEMIWLGMILLTAAIAIGWPYVSDMKAQFLIHKVVFACIAWLVFAALLFGRYRFGWRGVIATRWTLIGTAFLVLSYFGTKFVLEMVLGRF